MIDSVGPNLLLELSTAVKFRLCSFEIGDVAARCQTRIKITTEESAYLRLRFLRQQIDAQKSGADIIGFFHDQLASVFKSGKPIGKSEGDQQAEQRKNCPFNCPYIRWLRRLVFDFLADAPPGLHKADHRKDQPQCNPYGIRC